jgi:hypothetical protein
MFVHPDSALLTLRSDQEGGRCRVVGHASSSVDRFSQARPTLSFNRCIEFIQLRYTTRQYDTCARGFPSRDNVLNGRQ